MSKWKLIGLATFEWVYVQLCNLSRLSTCLDRLKSSWWLLEPTSSSLTLSHFLGVITQWDPLLSLEVAAAIRVLRLQITVLLQSDRLRLQTSVYLSIQRQVYFCSCKNVKRFCSSNKINFAATKLPVFFSGSCKSVTSHQVLHRSSLQKREIVTLKRIVPYPLSLPNKQTRNRIEPLSVCLLHQLSDSVNHETKLTANRAIKTTTTKIHTTYSALGRPLGKLFKPKDRVTVATYGWLAVQSLST